MATCQYLTKFGSGDFGIDEDEDGIIVQSISVSSSAEKAEVRDRCGSIVGVSYYGYLQEITLEAVLEEGSTYTPRVATVFAINNQTPDRFPTSITGGTVLIEDIDDTWTAGDYKKISVKASYYPAITATP